MIDENGREPSGWPPPENHNHITNASFWRLFKKIGLLPGRRKVFQKTFYGLKIKFRRGEIQDVWPIKNKKTKEAPCNILYSFEVYIRETQFEKNPLETHKAVQRAPVLRVTA